LYLINCKLNSTVHLVIRTVTGGWSFVF